LEYTDNKKALFHSLSVYIICYVKSFILHSNEKSYYAIRAVHFNEKYNKTKHSFIMLQIFYDFFILKQFYLLRYCNEKLESFLMIYGIHLIKGLFVLLEFLALTIFVFSLSPMSEYMYIYFKCKNC